MTRRAGQTDGDYRRRHNPDELAAVCWCRTRTVPVPKQEIRAGLTRSCGLPACDQHDRNHRTPGGTP